MTLADRLKGIKRGGGVSSSMIPIQTGANGDVITDAQAGDIVVAIHGYITNSTTTLLDGFTSIVRKSSSVQWNTGSSIYYVTGELQYKILTGDETTIPTQQGSGNWVQYRPSSPITSVTIQELVTSSGTSDLAGAYNSFPQNESLGCIRVVGTAGYTSTSTVQSLSTGDIQTIADANTSYSKFLSTNSYNAGTYSTTRGGFSSPCFYATIKCN